MNNISSTSFGCGHCRDAANKFVKAGIPEDLAKAKVAREVGASEHVYTDAHMAKARRYDFGMDRYPARFERKLATLKKQVAKLNVKA